MVYGCLWCLTIVTGAYIINQLSYQTGAKNIVSGWWFTTVVDWLGTQPATWAKKIVDQP